MERREQPTASSVSCADPAADDKARPFTLALNALKSATPAIGNPHAGVSTAVSATFNGSHGTHPSGLAKGRQLQASQKSLAHSAGTSPGGCRIGLNEISLLVGCGGVDATGRIVGVVPGNDMEAAILKHSSQVRRLQILTYHILRAFATGDRHANYCLRAHNLLRNVDAKVNGQHPTPNTEGWLLLRK